MASNLRYVLSPRHIEHHSGWSSMKWVTPSFFTDRAFFRAAQRRSGHVRRGMPTSATNSGLWPALVRGSPVRALPARRYASFSEPLVDERRMTRMHPVGWLFFDDCISRSIPMSDFRSMCIILSWRYHTSLDLQKIFTPQTIHVTLSPIWLTFVAEIFARPTFSRSLSWKDRFVRRLSFLMNPKPDRSEWCAHLWLIDNISNYQTVSYFKAALFWK